MTTSTIPQDVLDDEWLPDVRRCPSWCDKQHAQALAEGNGWERSQVHHVSGGGDCLPELTYAGRHVRDWGHGWDLVAEQRPLGPDGGYWGPVLISLDVHGAEHRGVSIELTSGDARVLARQLVALADRLDLE